MKAVAEIAIVGLIGTFAIIAGILIPPSVIKSTVGKEAILTYRFEKIQHALLTLFSSYENEKSVYETIGTNILLKKPTNTLKPQFDGLVGENYCISIIREGTQLPTGSVIAPPPREFLSGEILRSTCPADGVQFNTILVLPYNKNSLVEVIGIGVE